MGGWVGLRGLSQWYSCICVHGAKVNFGDLIIYLTCGLTYGWSGDDPHAVYREAAQPEAEPALVEAEALLRAPSPEQPVSLVQVTQLTITEVQKIKFHLKKNNFKCT